MVLEAVHFYAVLVCSLLGPGLEIKIMIGILKPLIYKPLFVLFTVFEIMCATNGISFHYYVY